MFRIPSRLDPIGTSPLIEAQTPSYLVREINFDWESKLPVYADCTWFICLDLPTSSRRPAMFYATMQRMANAISIHSYQRSRLSGTALFTPKASTDLSGISQAMTVIIRMILLSRW